MVEKEGEVGKESQHNLRLISFRKEFIWKLRFYRCNLLFKTIHAHVPSRKIFVTPHGFVDLSWEITDCEHVPLSRPIVEAKTKKGFSKETVKN